MAAATACSTGIAGVSISSTLGPGDTFDTLYGEVVAGPTSGYGLGLSYEVAAPFWPSQTLPLDAVRLGLFYYYFQPNTASALTVSIAPDLGNSPSPSYLEQATLNSVPAIPTLVTVEFNNVTELQANTLYWIVLKSAAPNTYDLWLNNSQDVLGMARRNDAAGNSSWALDFSTPTPAFDVVGYVPEAGTFQTGCGLALLVLGSAAAKVGRARAQRQSRRPKGQVKATHSAPAPRTSAR